MGWRATERDVALFLAARHADPFALLGPHAAAGGVVVRAFVPHAQDLSADGVALECRDEAGFFEGLI
jgi:1,4-alpha-glucan branching enzyme